MAEVLIRTQDKPLTGDPYIDRHRSRRGSVIVIMPDGHEWSAEERAAPFWYILSLPGISPHLLSQFTAPDLGYSDEEAEKLNRVLRRWSSLVDYAGLLDLLSKPARRRILREDPAQALVLILALKVAAPVLIDPAVIG